MKKAASIFACTLIILAFAFNNSEAQSIGLTGVGGRLGFVDASRTNGTIILGVHAELGEIIENLALVPSIDYFSKHSVSYLSFNGNVRYYFPSSSHIDFFGGGGLALLRVDLPAGLGSDTSLGLNLLGGADFPVSDNLIATAQLIYNTEGDQIKILGGITYLID
ncbi:MAG: hypothetical protein ACE5HS_08015 [bacterium]